MHQNKHFKTLRPFVTVLFIKGLLDVAFLLYFSINLLVVYRESMNLIGYITRRLSADSQQL